MIRQYNPQRYRVDDKGRKIGTISVGEIFRCSCGGKNQSWIIEAWHNREYHECVPGGRTIAMTGGHLATARNLGNGQRRTIADWLIRRLLGDE